MNLRAVQGTTKFRHAAVLGFGAMLAVTAAGCGSAADQSTAAASSGAGATATADATPGDTTSTRTSPGAAVGQSAGAGTTGTTATGANGSGGQAAGSAPQSEGQSAAAPVAGEPPAGSGHGLCFDVNSALARDAMASLAPAPQGGPWRIDKGSTDPLGQGCPDLSWMQVDDSATNDGTFVSQVLFFHGGRYLGTATKKPLSYTDVTGSDKDSVSVRYRWITDDDPLCCPQGGPSTVTFTWDGSSVEAKGQFPPAA